MKKLISRWKAPTPLFWRELGTSLSIASLAISGSAFAANISWLGYTALALTVISKEIMNFAVDKPAQ